MIYQFNITWPLYGKAFLLNTYKLLQEIEPNISKAETFDLITSTLPFVLKEFVGTVGNIVGDIPPGTKDWNSNRGVKSFFWEEIQKKCSGVADLVSGKDIKNQDQNEIEQILKFCMDAINGAERANTDLDQQTSHLLQKLSSNDLDPDDIPQIIEAMKKSDSKEKLRPLIHGLEKEWKHIQTLRDSRTYIGEIIGNEEIPWGQKFFRVVSATMKNTVNAERSKAALGHNLTDVVNVFPWQIMHGPFLAELLESGLSSVTNSEIVKQLEEKSELAAETLVDIISYVFIWGFSSFADNYLGCELGLKILPEEKAPIAIIASIYGGKNSKIGNMANLNLFAMDEGSFVEHMQAVFGTQIKSDIFVMIYAIVISKLKTMGMVPEIKDSH